MLPITPELAQAVAEEIKAGARLTHVAAKYTLPYSAVYAILEKQGIQYQELLEVRRLQGSTPYLKKRYGYLAAWYPGMHREDSAQEISVPEKYPDVTPEKLMEELISIHLRLGRCPKAAEVKKISRFGYQHYRSAFGTLGKAFRNERFTAAIQNSGREKTRQLLLDHLRELGRKQGFPPTKEQLVNDPFHGYMRYHRHFGGLRKALELAGFRLSINQKTGQRRMIKQMTEALMLLRDKVKEVKLENNATVEASFLLHKIEGNLQALDQLIRIAEYPPAPMKTDNVTSPGIAEEPAPSASTTHL